MLTITRANDKRAASPPLGHPAKAGGLLDSYDVAFGGVRNPSANPEQLAPLISTAPSESQVEDTRRTGQKQRYFKSAITECVCHRGTPLNWRTLKGSSPVTTAPAELTKDTISASDVPMPTSEDVPSPEGNYILPQPTEPVKSRSRI
ncbi:MAG: hypothetical protein HQK99_14590 [Nitrospirae bacterium]|nr:hypothetical protein [Nitrospirota bacterium]